MSPPDSDPLARRVSGKLQHLVKLIRRNPDQPLGFEKNPATSVALDGSHEPPRPTLQKYKVKSLDLFFVILTNCGSSVGERVGNQKLQLQLQLKNI